MRFLFLFLFLFFSFQQNSWSENILTEFLVAKPSMPDPRFKETVIVMLYHNQGRGAAGLVINKPIRTMLISEFFKSSIVGWSLLIVLGLNTLLAYGALAEAVECIPISLISVLITLNPFITLSGMWVLTTFGVGPLLAENIGWHGYLGGIIAVSGVVLVVASPNKIQEV